MTGASGFDPSQWTIVKSVRNPWGKVPLTAGGKSLPERTRIYMDRLLEQQGALDPSERRRHHYVPRTYLARWSFDGKRVWALDTVTGITKPLGLKDVCVKEDFYRVVGPDGAAHNRLELLFGVVETELRRVQSLFDRLEHAQALEFDDLIGLGVTMAVQRMRTAQERRLRVQHDAWLIAQNPHDFRSIEGGQNDPHRLAGIHTELLFQSMWDAADVLTTRQIEIWHDPQGRFMTCDAPVLVPFRRNVGPGLMSAQYILWPVSPQRVVALSNESVGEKAVIRQADGKLVGMVRRAIEQGRERMIFASQDQRDHLPKSKLFRRRAQIWLRCSDRTPDGECVPPPRCCVEQRTWYGRAPDVTLCSQGLHRPAPDMQRYT